MSNESEIRLGRLRVFKLHAHWVFVTKNRPRVFDSRTIDVLRDIFADVCSDTQATLVGIGWRHPTESSLEIFFTQYLRRR